MKVCYIGAPRARPKLPDHIFVHISRATFQDVYGQYFGYAGLLCLDVADDVPFGGLLKFVESAGQGLAVVVHRTPDLVFLSRFNQVVVWTKPAFRPFPDLTAAQALLKECQDLCR